MHHPYISICIPAYKNVLYLKRLLDSIRIQSYNNFEVVITDDSDTVDVQLLVEGYSSLPIRYFKNTPAIGMPGNWNTAIGLATGHWIKLMHDDDWFATPKALSTFAAYATNATTGFIFSACANIYDRSGKVIIEQLTENRQQLLADNPLNLFFANVIGHPSVLMHKNDQEIRYDTQFKWVVDIDFYIRFLQRHHGFSYIPEVLVNIGININQLSNIYYKNPHVELTEYLTLLAKYPKDLMITNQFVFHLVWNMIIRYKIKSRDKITAYGFHGSLPEPINSIIHHQKKYPRFILKQPRWSARLMQRCFRNMQLNN